MRRMMGGPMLKERLKRFQGLARAFEADGTGQEVVLGRRLGDDRADEIVGQDVRPNLLTH